MGEGNFTPLPLTSKRTPKKPTQIRVKNNIRKNSKSGLNLDNKTTLHKFLQNSRVQWHLWNPVKHLLWSFFARIFLQQRTIAAVWQGSNTPLESNSLYLKGTKIENYQNLGLKNFPFFQMPIFR